MEIEWIVTTGYGKGAYFIGQEFYKSKFNAKCGFEPYPGTRNINISEKYLENIQQIKDSCTNVIKAKEGFGGVKYIKATLNNDIIGAIVFPDKTTHDENYLEFIAKDNLRKKLNLEDGDKVKVKISID